MEANEVDIATIRKKLLVLREQNVFPEKELQAFFRDYLDLSLESFNLTPADLGRIREDVGAALKKIKVGGNGRSD